MYRCVSVAGSPVCPEQVLHLANVAEGKARIPHFFHNKCG